MVVAKRSQAEADLKQSPDIFREMVTLTPCRGLPGVSIQVIFLWSDRSPVPHAPKSCRLSDHAHFWGP